MNKSNLQKRLSFLEGTEDIMERNKRALQDIYADWKFEIDRVRFDLNLIKQGERDI